MCSAETAVRIKQARGDEVDAALRHLALNGGSQAKACSATGCLPMQLSRAIKALRDAGQYDEHMRDIKTAAAQATGVTVSPAPLIDMPTPRSLGGQIKSGANRLGDGRPYGSNGNSWGEYREAHKIGTSAIASSGPVTRAKAEAAAERLKQAGVSIGSTTLFMAAKNAPGASPPRMGEHRSKLPKGFLEAGRKLVLEMRELNLLVLEMRGLSQSLPACWDAYCGQQSSCDVFGRCAYSITRSYVAVLHFSQSIRWWSYGKPRKHFFDYVLR